MTNSENENITNNLYEITRQFPTKPAILHPKKTTFSELCSRINLYAVGFNTSGIKKGTQTIVLLKPGLDFFAVTFALLRIGAVPVLIDPGMGSKAMVQALSGTRAEAFIGIPKALLLRRVYPRFFKTVTIWISDKHRWFWQDFKLSSFRNKKEKFYTVSPTQANDLVAIFFTSGSTGPAKGVMYKNYMLHAQITLLKTHFKYSPGEIDCCTFPLIGLLSMCIGLSVVLADMNMTYPATLKPENLIKNIIQYKCTFMFCSPMVLQKLSLFGNQNKIILNSLKKVMTAGAPVSAQLLKDFQKMLPQNAEIHTPYGATEALPITDIHHKELLRLYEISKNGKGICVGLPLKGVELRIIKITDTPFASWYETLQLESGLVGEIAIKGKIVTQQYLNNNKANLNSKIEEKGSVFLWHRTGDLGKLDKNGNVWFYGRKSQRVETRGKTFFTIPTEAVFNQHPNVSRSALVGVKLKNKIKPVICIELIPGVKKSAEIFEQLRLLAKENSITMSINEFLFYKKLPVDPRHNAKILREKLAVWAQTKLK